MFFKNNNYNILIFLSLLVFIFMFIVIYFGNYEKLEKEKRKEYSKVVKYIFAFLGLVGVVLLIVKNMNQGIFKLFGVKIDRGLVVYIFTCFLIAFAF